MPSPALARKRPYSAKKRRAQLLEKRAIKRGDISPPQPVKADKHKVWAGHAAPSDSQAREAARRLQSAFVKLDKRFLQDSMEMAAVLHLERPVPDEVAILRAEPLVEAQLTRKLTCPARPEWRYDMSKQQLEENEEVVFQKWLDQADDIVHEWCNPFEVHPSDDETRSPAMPRAPTVFERNLEVWRQLWRVSEISQIILVLLDSRCPLLHFPPSLVAYLSASHEANRTRTILVLTKVDIIGPTRADEWTRSLQAKYPGMPVVRVEAYAEADQTTDQGKGKTHAHQPHIPLQFKESLVQALRDMHAELLEPPQRPEGSIFLQRRSVVRKSVSWDAVLHAQGEQVGTVVGGASASSLHGAEGTESEPEYLTVGLIGQPNVGKSSLLNALFGINKVQASHTPGKNEFADETFPNAVLDTGSPAR
ncbi:hypothetical protein EUX98_g5260 [Antrodiella citrinella]|uniref:Guanine nucleotide-binding protein-like 1 n=1 Tax=Antrodiella citrinella TaxID=2447956 RepID=A0A4S4MUG5_9APHY|nr:hypothetical protein EUX98_g5260 [Antrodiella citrinella]